MFEIFTANLVGTLPSLLAGWCGGFYGGRGFGMMGGYWPFGMLFMGIFWIAVIAFVVWVIWRLTRGKRMTRVPAEQPIDILRRRLATGEITADEFNRLKKAIDEKK
jgi:putative membrane protein